MFSFWYMYYSSQTEQDIKQFQEVIDILFVLDFFISLIFLIKSWMDWCMIEKNTVLVICIHKQVKSIVFAMSIKFCDEWDLVILSAKRSN